MVSPPRLVGSERCLHGASSPSLVAYRLAFEDAECGIETVDETVDVVEGVVDIKAGAGRTHDAQGIHEWLGTVMTGADGNVFGIEDAGNVVRVNVSQIEGNDAAAESGIPRPVDRDAGQLGQSLQC